MLKSFLSIILLLFCTSTFSQENSVSIVSGGWSWHWFDKSNSYNERHNITGFEYGSDHKYFGIYNFQNSYNKNSYLISLHENKCGSFHRVQYCYGAFGGYVSGYERFSLIIAPEFLVKYNLSQSFTLGSAISCLPGLCAATIKLTIKN